MHGIIGLDLFATNRRCERFSVQTCNTAIDTMSVTS